MLPHGFMIRATGSRVGQSLDLETFADWIRLPMRGDPTRFMDGATMKKLVGIRSKSWDLELFRDPETVAAVGRGVIEAAAWRASDIDLLVTVTCTPYGLRLDQDAFLFARALGLRDEVAVVHFSSGCGGMARVFEHLRGVSARRVLVLTYSAVSPLMTLPDGSPNHLYRDNDVHPSGSVAWFSPALFSDGAAALALQRSDERQGLCSYSRGGDCEDPLVRFDGGGAQRPPGHPECEAYSVFTMSGDAVARFYLGGMRANHRALDEARPGWSEAVARIYTHQASPALVRGYLGSSGLPLDKVPVHVETMGNLVAPCTVVLLDDDLKAGRVRSGDEVCFSVVGAGPERGAAILRVALPD